MAIATRDKEAARTRTLAKLEKIEADAALLAEPEALVELLKKVDQVARDFPADVAVAAAVERTRSIVSALAEVYRLLSAAQLRAANEGAAEAMERHPE